MSLKILFSLLLSLTISSFVFAFPLGTKEVYIANIKGVRASLLQNITTLVQHAIAEGQYPGAVILISHRDHIIYRGVFGSRRIIPNAALMQFDTIFDIASLTKVVATTPAVMQLLEQGKLELDDPVTKYWPNFGAHDKHQITIRELLTHTSGLPTDMGENEGWRGEKAGLQHIEQLKLKHLPGSTFLYSDVNFVILAHLVELISHEPFDAYVQNHIFKPLNMTHTMYLPSVALKDRIAPTELINNNLHWGFVHDPIAFAMGGVAGNAGIFSNASDLGLYAQCLLNNGRINKKTQYLLGPLTVLKMTSPETLIETDKRGLGWDIDSAYTNRGVLFSMTSYGHTGWTGTSLWIDPTTQTWIIILTSRTHPRPLPSNPIIQDRRAIANIVAASITDVTPLTQTNTTIGELYRAYSLKGQTHRAM